MKQPNRIAALGGSLGAVAAVLLAILGAVDTDRKAAVLIAALILLAVVVAVFLRGSQRFDALLARSSDLTRELEADAARPAQTTIVNAPSAKTVDTSSDGPSVASGVVSVGKDPHSAEQGEYLTEDEPETGEPTAEDPA